MRLSPDQFRNKHGNGAVRMSTAEATSEQLDYATSLGGDFSIKKERRFPVIWRFSSSAAAVAFKLRFSEEAFRLS